MVISEFKLYSYSDKLLQSFLLDEEHSVRRQPLYYDAHHSHSHISRIPGTPTALIRCPALPTGRLTAFPTHSCIWCGSMPRAALVTSGITATVAAAAAITAATVVGASVIGASVIGAAVMRRVVASIPAAAVARGVVATIAAARVIIGAACRVMAGAVAASTTPATGILYVCSSLASCR